MPGSPPVQKLLFQGDAYFRTGQFDKSEETYSKILILDPYNKAAREEKWPTSSATSERADEFRHEQYEAESMERLDHKWGEEISPDIVTPAAGGADPFRAVQPRGHHAQALLHHHRQGQFREARHRRRHSVPAAKRARSSIPTTRASTSSCA
ncbi:MAG: tetratricopeptide repeat protein [Verrucomicrobiota bacterium]